MGKGLRYRDGGFTLVELLVVVAIVLILGAMVVTALPEGRRQAQQAQCAANIHRLGLAWQMLRKDYDGEWSRARCAPEVFRPEAMADLAGLGYVEGMEVYVCPDLESPHPRSPSLNYWAEQPPYAQVKLYVGDMREQCYFADEFRIPRQPLEQRAVMADGIEMVTRYGKEPANHADGANVLFADMAVQWVAKSLPDQSWVMDKYKVWEGERIGGPGYYGVIDGAQARWFPDCRAGTWRRRGYIENPRLLDPEMGSATGEDDIPNMLGGAPNDVDDIYYVDCDLATWGGDYGDACRWGFISYSYVSRCRNARTDKSARDCSLAGGSVFNWRGSYDAPWVNSSVPPEYAGMTWGHPDELR